MNRTIKLVAFFIVFVLPVAGTISYFSVIGNQIHTALGEYGVRIEYAEGLINSHDASFISATYWNGYSLFESSVTKWLVSAVVFGMILGSLAMLGVLRIIRKEEG
jgi:amino acid permease